MPAFATAVADQPAAVIDRYRRLVEDAVGHPVGDGAGPLLDAVLERLAASDAYLVIADLDDLLGERAPHNVPGPSARHDVAATVEGAAVGHAVGRRPATSAVAEQQARNTMTEHDDEHPNPLGELDLFLFNEGTHRHLHRCLGAHPDADGTWFAVWAPTARSVDVLGDFDGWTGQAMAPVGQSGLWSARVDGARIGQSYRYAVTSGRGERIEKSDPLAAANNEPPSTASLIADVSYEWGDDDWMTARGSTGQPDAPDLDLRGASRLVGSPRHTGPSVRPLRRAGRPAGRSRRRRTGSRTWSCSR